MEVLNRFEKLRTAVSSSVSSTVFSTISTVKDVLPGNPVTREFDIGEHVASGGPGLLWKIYSGSKKSTKQPAAVFVLEKRILEQTFQKSEREALLEQFRKAIAQLTRLRHPQVLTVQHPLEESRDCLAFATEPVYASFANVLGNHDNLPRPVPAHLRDYKLFDVEIKYGLLQLCEGLAFLHESVKLIHRNISPDSIILNEQGAWKIFGFDFCLPNTTEGAPTAWDHPPVADEAVSSDPLRPDLDFMAPEHSCLEHAGISRLSSAADMFSLGMVALSLYNSKPLFTNGGRWSSFRKNSSEFKALRDSNLHLVPSELRPTLKLMLSSAPELRPTAAQLAQIQFLSEDVGVKTLNNLDTQFQWDNLQKSQFYKGLPHVLPRLPHRVALHRVVPCLAKEFVNSQMVPFVLPSVLYVAEEASAADFVNRILPELKPVMKITEPIQVLLIFMQKMDMLLSKTPPSEVRSDVLPMVYKALEADTPQVQELCLSIIPGFAGLLEFQATKTSLLPRIKKLCMSTSLLSVRVNCLVCIGKLLPHLDKWLVLDDVLPMLQQVPSNEPAVIMAIVGIYKLTLSDSKLGMTKEIIAAKVLPFLFPLSIANGLTMSQYSAVVSLIRELMDKVEEENRAKLQQLSSIQSEQRSALQVSMSSQSCLRPDQLVPDTNQPPKSQMDAMFSGLGLESYISVKDSGSLATNLMPSETSSMSPMRSVTKSASLTLQQKQRILQDSESQRKLTQETQMGTTKDLTSSLINANLNQMKTTTTTSSSSQRPAQKPNYNWTPGQSSKPDLSAFDSLLPMKAKQHQPMNSMGQKEPGGIMRPTLSLGSSQQVKSLTASDINDLLN